MRVLLVEDNASFAKTIDDELSRIPNCVVVWAKSKASALNGLENYFFDLVILDRKIPAQDDEMVASTEHGWAVFQSLIANYRGVPVWFLTGTTDEDFPTHINNEYGRRDDFLCNGTNIQLYKVHWKRNMDACVKEIDEIAGQVDIIEGIQLTTGDGGANLRPEETRVLKLFGRRYGGTTVEANPLKGGLSDARVFQVLVKNAGGNVIQSSVAKIDTHRNIDKEKKNFDDHIRRLQVGAYPAITLEVHCGASGFAGIFYHVVEGTAENLFEQMSSDISKAAAVPSRLKTAQQNWINESTQEEIKVGEIRRLLIRDIQFDEVRGQLEDENIEAIENVSLDGSRCVGHGDLHCANVLFDADNRPVFIDYADTKRVVASLDAVVLELSTVFHTNAPETGNWPSVGEAQNWPDIERFVENCPFPDFVKACRAWADEVAGSQEEIWACAYAFSARQLKYQDTDKDIAKAIIQACRKRLLPQTT